LDTRRVKEGKKATLSKYQSRCLLREAKGLRDEEHVNYIKKVVKNKDTFIKVLENDRALSNMLYDMIKNINATPPNSP